MKATGETWTRVGATVSAKSLFIAEAQARGSETCIVVPVSFMRSKTDRLLPAHVNQPRISRRCPNIPLQIMARL